MIKVTFKTPQTICANKDQGGCLVMDYCLTYHDPITKNEYTFIKPITGYGFIVLNNSIKSTEQVNEISEKHGVNYIPNKETLGNDFEHGLYTI